LSSSAVTLGVEVQVCGAQVVGELFGGAGAEDHRADPRLATQASATCAMLAPRPSATSRTASTTSQVRCCADRWS